MPRVPSKISGWSNQSRTFYGLTQTCRLIRLEFRPLHQSYVKVSVGLPQVERYINAFIPEVQTKPSEACANIKIAAFTCGHHCVAPLIRMLSESSNIEITYARDCDSRHLQSLLHAKNRNPEWWSYFQDRVQHICVYWDVLGFVVDVDVYVKSQFEESWMKDFWCYDVEMDRAGLSSVSYECANHRWKWRKELNFDPDPTGFEVNCLGVGWHPRPKCCTNE
jgi:hypothetical protein